MMPLQAAPPMAAPVPPPVKPIPKPGTMTEESAPAR